MLENHRKYFKSYFKEGGYQLFNNRPAIYQEYQHEIVKQYNSLCESYEAFKQEIESIYNAAQIYNQDKNITDKVDDIAISEDYKKDFQAYEIDREKVVRAALKNKELYNEVKIEKLFNIRRKQLDRSLKKASVNNIGTNLNILKEFYHDVLNDVQRNKSRWLNAENELTNYHEVKDIEFQISRKRLTYGDIYFVNER